MITTQFYTIIFLNIDVASIEMKMSLTCQHSEHSSIVCFFLFPKIKLPRLSDAMQEGRSIAKPSSLTQMRPAKMCLMNQPFSSCHKTSISQSAGRVVGLVCTRRLKVLFALVTFSDSFPEEGFSLADIEVVLQFRSRPSHRKQSCPCPRT